MSNIIEKGFGLSKN